MLYKNLGDFIDQNHEKEFVVIQGLGFVGAVMSLVCSNSPKNYAVIGVDTKSNKNLIDSINNGIFPIKSTDPKVEDYFKKSIKKRNLYATYDSTAYSLADTIIVDINLDVIKNSDKRGNLISYDVDLNPFKNAMKTIGENCKHDSLILIETTVPPGTCLKVVKPIIEAELSKRKLPTNKIKIGHSYERVMPGPDYIDSIKNYYRVYSGINDYSADKTEEFLKSIISTKKFPLTRLINTNATEIAKVLENSYRAMNIAFAVEWSRYAEEANVNLYEIVDAIRMRPTHTNLMYPGIGVGGYCLTKDPLLASWARLNHFAGNEGLNQSEAGVKINDKMPFYAFQNMKMAFELESLKNKKILLLGVSYRGDVGDTRYSPVEPFYLQCLNEDAKIYVHDPFVKYWDEIKLDLKLNLNQLFKEKWDFVVISTGHSLYKSRDFVDKLSRRKGMLIYDSVGLFSAKQLSKLSKNNKVKVLGRGDI